MRSFILGRGLNRRFVTAALSEAAPRLRLGFASLRRRQIAGRAWARMRALRTLFPDAKLTEEDGLRFDWPDGWLHVRMSMTEPILRIITEWKKQSDAAAKLMHIRAAVERLVAE